MTIKTTKSKSRTKAGAKLSCQPGCSFKALPFHGVDTRKDDGSNHYEAEFATIKKLLMEHYQTFSVNDAYSLSRGLDLPYPVIKAEFASFVKTMCAQGRLRQIASCMDDDTFSVCHSK